MVMLKLEGRESSGVTGLSKNNGIEANLVEEVRLGCTNFVFIISCLKIMYLKYMFTSENNIQQIMIRMV